MMLRKHFVLTTLTAYAEWEGPRAADPKKGFRDARIGRTRKQLAQYLAGGRSIPGTSIEVQPLILSFRERHYEKHGWCYEYGDGPRDSYISHMDSLYEVILDGRNADESIH